MAKSPPNNDKSLRKKQKRQQALARKKIDQEKTKKIVERQMQLESDDEYLPLSWSLDSNKNEFNEYNKKTAEDLEEPTDPGDFTTTDHSEHDYLWVLEPSDLDELSIEEVKLIWSRRNELCGSIEVAAEALAIIEVYSGITSRYAGWQKYVNHESINELKEILSNSATSEEGEQVIDLSAFKATPPSSNINRTKSLLTTSSITKLSIDEVKDIWDKRYEAPLTLSGACAALARLRCHNGIDSKQKHWSAFIDHEEIQNLEHLTEEDDKPISTAPLSDDDESIHTGKAESIISDRRSKSYINTVVRLGQGAFRKEVLQHYERKCCITKCTEVSLLEAAHINPYTGKHSNIIENSLCLRVDLHRLFDKILLSINPDTHDVVISESVNDHFYKSLNGKHLNLSNNPLFKKMLARHYETFNRIESSRNLLGAGAKQ